MRIKTSQRLAEIADSLANIGSALKALGEIDEALENVKAALQIEEKILGHSHTNASTTYEKVG